MSAFGTLPAPATNPFVRLGGFSERPQTPKKPEDAARREAFLEAVAHGSVIAWQHINPLGEYDSLDEKLQNRVGIRPQNSWTKRGRFLRAVQIAKLQTIQEASYTCHVAFGSFVGI
jgi:hypothetical protein